MNRAELQNLLLLFAALLRHHCQHVEFVFLDFQSFSERLGDYLRKDAEAREVASQLANFLSRLQVQVKLQVF